MPTVFNFSGNPVLQALAAYQGQYSAAKAAADRQSQVQAAQYGAQEGQNVGAGLASGINTGVNLGFTQPYLMGLQRQQYAAMTPLEAARQAAIIRATTQPQVEAYQAMTPLEAARQAAIIRATTQPQVEAYQAMTGPTIDRAVQESQRVTIPQIHEHAASQSEAYRNHLANQMGVNSWDDFADIGRNVYQQAGATAGTPESVAPLAQAAGVSYGDLVNPDIVHDNNVMGRLGFGAVVAHRQAQQVQNYIQEHQRARAMDVDAQRARDYADNKLEAVVPSEKTNIETLQREVQDAPPERRAQYQQQLQDYLKNARLRPVVQPAETTEQLRAGRPPKTNGFYPNLGDGYDGFFNGKQMQHLPHSVPDQNPQGPFATTWEEYDKHIPLRRGDHVVNPRTGQVIQSDPKTGKEHTVSPGTGQLPQDIPALDPRLPAATHIRQIAAGTHSFQVLQPVDNGHGGVIMLRGFSPKGSAEFEHIAPGKEVTKEDVSYRDVLGWMKHMDVKPDWMGKGGHKATPHEALDSINTTKQLLGGQAPPSGPPQQPPGAPQMLQLPPRGTEPEVGKLYQTNRGPAIYQGGGRLKAAG